MKPAIIQHTEYKRMLRARLNAHFPDKSEIQKEIAPLYRKFRDLDLSAVDRISSRPRAYTLGPSSEPYVRY